MRFIISRSQVRTRDVAEFLLISMSRLISNFSYWALYCTLVSVFKAKLRLSIDLIARFFCSKLDQIL